MVETSVHYRGQHLMKVDSKGRMSLPYTFRNETVGDIVFIMHPSSPAIVAINQSIKDDNTAKLAAIFSGAVNLDNNGRTVLTAQQRKHIKLEVAGEVMVVGMKNHFQVWSADNWENVKDFYAKELVRRLEPELDIFVPNEYH